MVHNTGRGNIGENLYCAYPSFTDVRLKQLKIGTTKLKIIILTDQDLVLELVIKILLTFDYTNVSMKRI